MNILAPDEVQKFYYEGRKCVHAINKIAKLRVINQSNNYKDCESLLDYGPKYINCGLVKYLFEAKKESFYDDSNAEDITAISPLPEGSKRVGLIFESTFSLVLLKKEGDLWTLPTIVLTDDGVEMPGVDDGNILKKFRKVSYMDVEVREGDEKVTVRGHFFLGVEWEPPNKEEFQWYDIDVALKKDVDKITSEARKLLARFYDLHFKKVEHIVGVRSDCAVIMFCDLMFYEVGRLINKDTSFKDCEALLQSFVACVDRRKLMRFFNKKRIYGFLDDNNEKHLNGIKPLPDRSKRVGLIFEHDFVAVLLKKEGDLWTLPTIVLTDDGVEMPGVDDGNILKKFRKVSYMDVEVREGDEKVTVRGHFFLGVEWEPPDKVECDWHDLSYMIGDQAPSTAETKQVLGSFQNKYLKEFNVRERQSDFFVEKEVAVCHQAVRIVEFERVVNKKTTYKDCSCLLESMTNYKDFYFAYTSPEWMFKKYKGDFYDDENAEDIEAIPPLPEGSKRVGLIFNFDFSFALFKKKGDLWTLPTIVLTDDGMEMPGVDIDNIIQKFSLVSFMDVDVGVRDGVDEGVEKIGSEEAIVKIVGEEAIVRAHYFLNVQMTSDKKAETAWFKIVFAEGLVTDDTLEVLKNWLVKRANIC